jgi:hypothetical protein
VGFQGSQEMRSPGDKKGLTSVEDVAASKNTLGQDDTAGVFRCGCHIASVLTTFHHSNKGGTRMSVTRKDQPQ